MTTASYPIGKVKGDDLAMHFKCVCLKPYTRFLETKFGEEKARAIIADMGMNYEHLGDPNAWVSYGFVCRLLARLVSETGDKMAPFKAAIAHTCHDTYGALGFFLTHLGSPATMYKLAAQFHSLWDRVCEWNMEKISSDRCSIRVTYRPPFRQDRNNCLALMGSLAAFPKQFGLPVAKVEHPACACDSNDYCEYRLQWVNQPGMKWGLTGMAACLFLGFLACTASGWRSWTIFMSAISGIAGFFAGREFDYKGRLQEVYSHNDKQADSLLQSMRDLENLRDHLEDTINLRTEELKLARDKLAETLKELEDTQEQRIQSERQAAIGVLAAGMAHELNSPINAIRLSTQSLLEDADAGSGVGRHLRNIERASGRCKRLVAELLCFSREDRFMSTLDIVQIVRETLATYRREHSDGFVIEERLPETMPGVTLDRIQIQQAIINLLDNAYDAMQGAGNVKVELAAEGSGIILRIRDFGPGIREDMLRDLMKPFRTTKPAGHHGLGLSITDFLVKKNRGSISVKSKVGEGTEFTIFFPADKAGRQDSGPSAGSAHTTGAEAS